jgi:putative component of membrane protein insertase Oxa1/YidC/SpoIIIJ protein YidD
MFFLAVSANSQEKMKDDLERLSGVFAPVETKQVDTKKIDFKNEIRLILSSSYKFYKAFISTQDANNCAFYPSCSTYALETIQTNGFFGIFDAIDRLTRCNGFSNNKYPVHSESKHLYDPVKKIL